MEGGQRIPTWLVGKGALRKMGVRVGKGENFIEGEAGEVKSASKETKHEKEGKI